MGWDEAKTRVLLEMNSAGASDQAIADVLQVTRCAVIGKRNRLGLAPTFGVGRAKDKARGKKARPPKPRNKSNDVFAAGSDFVVFNDLAENHCRWPLNHERHGTVFCGKQRLPTASYCAHHQAASIGKVGAAK